jgi:hypothetical protein
MVTQLVTLDAVKRHLHIDANDDDANLAEKIEQMSEAVLGYANQASGWADPASTPLDAQLAVILAVEAVYAPAGKGEGRDFQFIGHLPKCATDLLYRYRDPVLA